MGDRSFCSFSIPRSVYLARREEIDEILEPEFVDEDSGPLVRFDCPERDGGGFDEANSLTEAGVAHIASWDAGCDYGAGASAFIPGEPTAEVSTIAGGPAVPFDEETGRVCERELADCLAFAALKRRLIALAAPTTLASA